MIKVLDLQERSTWLPSIKEELKEHIELLDMPSELIINRIINGNLVVYNVNDELVALCYQFLSGNELVFFIYYTFGKNVRNNLLEIVKHVKTDLRCDRLEFFCCSNAHARFYEAIFNSSKKVLKKEYYYRLKL